MHRLVGLFLLTSTVAVALSACGGSSIPGVLTSAEIPSYLGLTANPSATTTAAHQQRTDDHCKKAGAAVFTLPGWTPPMTGSILSMTKSDSGPIVVSVDESCSSPSDAHMAFKSDAAGIGQQIDGIGDEATLLDLSAGQRSYEVAWREGSQIGAVLVVGLTNDNRITHALVELLARQAAAGS
jgi:hypothetical protein